jgi:L-ascorbate metabolism protein UlaG (beta-lactamase superfamily)
VLEAETLTVPALVVSMHYGTLDTVKQDPQAFKQKAEAEKETKSKCVALRPGESYELRQGHQ